MRSADNGFHISFVHVSPSGLTSNLNGEGEAHIESLRKVSSAIKTCSDTSFERKFRFIETKIASLL